MLMMVKLNQRSSPPSSWMRYCVGGVCCDDAVADDGVVDVDSKTDDDVDVVGSVDCEGEFEDDWNDDVMVGGAEPTGNVLLLTIRPWKN